MVKFVYFKFQKLDKANNVVFSLSSLLSRETGPHPQFLFIIDHFDIDIFVPLAVPDKYHRSSFKCLFIFAHTHLIKCVFNKRLYESHDVNVSKFGI